MLVDKYIFQKHLEKGESVLYVVHKHWTQFLPRVLNVIFLGWMAPWIFYFAGLKTPLYVGLIFLWMVLAILRLVYDWINWYADVWILTNMSVIVVQWNGFFSNTSQRISYEDVEGLSFAIKGFWGTVFRFGDATLQVLSGSHVTMNNARNPKEIELSLMKHQGSYMESRSMIHSENLKQILSQMVAQHLRRK